MAPNPRCAVCGNAYMRWLCPPCRADPANAGWQEGDEILGGPLEGGGAWEGLPAAVPPVYARVVRELLARPRASLSATARAAGCSVAYVSQVASGLCAIERQLSLADRACRSDACRPSAPP